MDLEVSFARTVRAIIGVGGEGDQATWCRLCLGEAKDDPVRLVDVVQFQRSFCVPEMILSDIISSLGCPLDQDSIYSTIVCKPCTNAAINAYVFREFCMYSQKMWKKAQNALLQCELNKVETKSRKSVYIILDENPRVLREMPHSENKKKSLCWSCGKAFVSEESLKRHKCKKKTSFTCADCQKSFISESKYKVHQDRYHGVKTVQCPHCPKRFASEYLLKEHCKAIHISRKCQVCNKEYKTRKASRDHEHSHAIEWFCVCGKMYKYRDGLRLHEARCPKLGLNKECKYPCPQCEKVYSFRHTLRHHIQFVHGNNPIQCNICNKKFITGLALRNHMSKHTGFKNYKCKQCNASFVSSTTLIYHMRALHTGERPFPCDECSLSFITSSRRTEHKRKLHGAPAPSCLYCNKRFTNLPSLRKHQKKYHENSNKPQFNIENEH